MKKKTWKHKTNQRMKEDQDENQDSNGKHSILF